MKTYKCKLISKMADIQILLTSLPTWAFPFSHFFIGCFCYFLRSLAEQIKLKALMLISANQNYLNPPTPQAQILQLSNVG